MAARPKGSQSDNSRHATSTGKHVLGSAPTAFVKPRSSVTIPLSDYIGLGCIHVKLVDSDGRCQPRHTWAEADCVLPRIELVDDMQNAMVALWRNASLRVLRMASTASPQLEVWRLYLLPDDVAQGTMRRHKSSTRKHLLQFLQILDVSAEAWNNVNPDPALATQYSIRPSRFSILPIPIMTSLFYLFNTVPSPNPTIETIPDRHSRLAMRQLLVEGIPGMKTEMYSYQRRSAAEMLKREVAPSAQLDPRLELRRSPAGDMFYYNSHETIFLRSAATYDSVKGGILAEDMGLGKTLISIALILATKGHWPMVPPQYDIDRHRTRPKVASLVDMAAATLTRHSIPWQNHLSEVEVSQCTNRMQHEKPQYSIPPVLIRQQRFTDILNQPRTIRLCSTTAVVVPKNLVAQWQSELHMHVESGALRVLLMERNDLPLPAVDELATYDVILFSKPRFELENKEVGLQTGLDYESPLRSIHFLRIIIDEGHNVSSSKTRAATAAEALVRAERRWIVSGTPIADVMGVEVESASLTQGGPVSEADREVILEHRKCFNAYVEECSGAIKALGSLASRFLKAQPWAAAPRMAGEIDGAARWEDYMLVRGESHPRICLGFSPCLPRTLNNLVVKTRPEDVGVNLPPLTHQVVRLRPCFYDKLTANLFVLLILSNAVTSERQDMDYLFHKSSQAHLHRLISSLRQSAFYWTGMNNVSVQSSLDVTWKYLAKDGTKCTPEDREQLTNAMDAARYALESPVWKAVTREGLEDVALLLQDWPRQESAIAWAFDGCDQPMITGLRQCLEAQRYINRQLSSDDPMEGFAAAGGHMHVREAMEQEELIMKHKNKTARGGDSGSTTELSSTAEPMAQRLTDDGHLLASDIASMSSPRKARKSYHRSDVPASMEPAAHGRKRWRSKDDTKIELSSGSALGRVAVKATASAKLTYLVDRIVSLQESEKSLVFYDGNFIAYHIASMLDILNIKYLVYSNDISLEQKGKYLVLFNRDPKQRVMLMDIKQAAHGLNVYTASRVFFTNPVCKPNIEVQAIKRAHRIGQTRPVHVETIVLAGTVEEAMYERASRMTKEEHLQARTLEDDRGVAEIIQQARILPYSPEEEAGWNRMAKLRMPQQLFGRPGRGKVVESNLEREVFGDEGSDSEEAKPPEKRGRRNSNVVVKRVKKKVRIKAEPMD